MGIESVNTSIATTAAAATNAAATSGPAATSYNYTNSNGYTEAQNNVEKYVERYSSIAESSGLTMSDYYKYDNYGEVCGFDMVKFNDDLRYARSSEEEKESKVDSFSKSEAIKTVQQKQQKKADAKVEKSNIDDEYKKALEQYASFINKTENQDIQKEWASLQAQEQKLTSVTASSTTILEGAKEFISNLTKVVMSTDKSTNNSETSVEKQDQKNAKVLTGIEKTTNESANLLDNYFFKSAYEISKKKDDGFLLDA